MEKINLGVVSVEMVFKALILCEVTKEEEMDREEGNPRTEPAASHIRRDLHPAAWFWHLRVSRLSVGRGGGGDVIGSVFQISGSAGSPVVIPSFLAWREGNLRASH